MTEVIPVRIILNINACQILLTLKPGINSEISRVSIVIRVKRIKPKKIIFIGIFSLRNILLVLVISSASAAAAESPARKVSELMPGKIYAVTSTVIVVRSSLTGNFMPFTRMIDETNIVNKLSFRSILVKIYREQEPEGGSSISESVNASDTGTYRSAQAE